MPCTFPSLSKISHLAKKAPELLPCRICILCKTKPTWKMAEQTFLSPFNRHTESSNPMHLQGCKAWLTAAGG